MATTDKGAIAVINLFCGSGAVNAYNASNARVGVGDSSTAYSAAQTDLQAATNKLRKLVDSAPSITSNAADFTATFALAEANFAWNEIALFNSSSGDYMATRRTISLGTKPSSEAWTITLQVTATAN